MNNERKVNKIESVDLITLNLKLKRVENNQSLARLITGGEKN